MYLDKNNNLEKIIFAIVNNRMISFTYTKAGDTATNQKIIAEPFLVGTLKTKEVKIDEPIFLSAWYCPTDIEKAEGKTDGWKLYDLNRMKDLVVMAETFSPKRKYYNKNDSRMKVILARIEKNA